MTIQTQSPRWLDFLEEDDLSFIKRFVMASGSLKELAGAYGISYPTVRLRLDRLIEKIKIVDAQTVTGSFERTLRLAFADGRIDPEMFKTLLAAHRQELENHHE